MEQVFDMFQRKLENSDGRWMWATTRCYEFCLQFIYHLRKLVGNPSASLETPDEKRFAGFFEFHFINATFNREWMTRFETPSWIWGGMTRPPNPLLALKNNGCWRILGKPPLLRFLECALLQELWQPWSLARDRQRSGGCRMVFGVSGSLGVPVCLNLSSLQKYRFYERSLYLSASIRRDLQGQDSGRHAFFHHLNAPSWKAKAEFGIPSFADLYFFM